MPLKLVRRPKSSCWIIRGTIRGVRVEESTRTSNKGIGEEIRAKREAEILTELIYGRGATCTFAKAGLGFLENHRSPRFLTNVLNYFGTMPLAQINLEAIEEGARKSYPNASASTRNRQFFTPAVAVLNYAAVRGWCAPPIIERPAAPGDRIRWLRPEEAERLIYACAEHLRPLVVFLLYTGARVGEALWLNWHDVDLTRAHVSFPNTKNGSPRGVPLHRRVVAELAKLPHREGEVFRRPDGLPYSRTKGINDTSAGTRIKTAFRAACRRAGIEDFHPHDCRHTWATWHYISNRDLGALMRLGGWKTERMVMRYAHVNVEELADTMDRLPGGKLG